MNYHQWWLFHKESTHSSSTKIKTWFINFFPLLIYDGNNIVIWRKSYSVNSKTSKTNFSSLIPFGSTGICLKMKVQNLMKWSSSQNNPFCLQATHVCLISQVEIQKLIMILLIIYFKIISSFKGQISTFTFI